VRRSKFNCTAFPLLVLVLLTFLTVQESSADFYKYTDKNGIVNMTNNRESVLKQNRAKAHVIKEEIRKPAVAGTLVVPGQSAEASNAEVATAEPEKVSIARTLTAKYGIPLLVVFTFISLFIYMGTLCEVLRVRQFATVLRLLMFSMVVVYVYQLGAQRMTATFVTLKQDALAIKNNIEGRENRTEQILNGTAVQDPKENQ
jgi:hypothetical protein